MKHAPAMLLVIAALLCSCGEDAPKWTHRLHADDIPYLAIPGFKELPPQEKDDIWSGRQHTFAPTSRARAISTHGRWTRVQVATSATVVTVYVPTETVAPL